MRGLLWKDLRMNRAVILLGGVLVVLPYVVGELLAIRSGGGWWGYREIEALGSIGLALAVIPMTFLGGNAFAREREDGSALFLATLPPSRSAVAFSKLLVAGGAALGYWGFSAMMILGVGPRMRDAPPVLVPGVHDDPLVEFWYVVVCHVLLFGTAWGFSATSSRGSSAVASAILVSAITLGGILAVSLGANVTPVLRVTPQTFKALPTALI